jgi:ATP-dependent DNA helicase RecG
MTELTQLPPWVDADLSADIGDLAATGERHDLEFKERIPEQTRDLAKEIAAFATSQAGVILLGIAQSGEIVGLADCESAVGREKLCDRIAGIAGIIKPPITPRLKFAHFEGATVLAIEVPKGDAPVYYVHHIPYVRYVTTTRPAEPQEVIDAVLAWDGSDKPSPESSYADSLLQLVVLDVMVNASELDERHVNPWLRELRLTLETSATLARDLAVKAPSSMSGAAGLLNDLASALDRVVYQQLTLGGYGWPEMRAAAKEAIEVAREIKEKWIDPVISDKSVADVWEDTAVAIRKFLNMNSHLDQWYEQSRLDDIRRRLAIQDSLC